MKKAKVCLKQKTFRTYSTKLEELSINAENITNVLFFLSFTEKLKIINDEVLIFSNIDLLSSLGGALGLFIGFSFFGYIGTILDATVDKCVAGSFKRCVIIPSCITKKELSTYAIKSLLFPHRETTSLSADIQH